MLAMSGPLRIETECFKFQAIRHSNECHDNMENLALCFLGFSLKRRILRNYSSFNRLGNTSVSNCMWYLLKSVLENHTVNALQTSPTHTHSFSVSQSLTS